MDAISRRHSGAPRRDELRCAIAHLRISRFRVRRCASPRNDQGHKMLGWWGNKGGQSLAVSADFTHALMQQVLRTELIRVKALTATTALLALMMLTLYFFDPYAINHLWHGRLNPFYLFAILIPFILFELWVHTVISRHLRLDRDVPVYRRYLGALIETSMPTLALALEIDSMGSVEALGFVVPLSYFIFIILSTLRLDFWLSTFTR